MARDDEREARDPEAIASRADRDHLHSLGRVRRRRAAWLIVLLAVVVVLVVFVIRNSQRVPVDFVFYRREARLIWVMLACAVLGGAIGFLVGRPGRTFRFHRPDEAAREPDRET